MTAIARRTLLRMLAWLPLGLLSGAAARAAAARPQPIDDSTFAVGTAYLAAHPEERRRLQHEPLGARRDLDRRVRRDFEDGDVVWVRGFLLARSEARYCAKRVLEAQRAPSSSDT